MVEAVFDFKAIRDRMQGEVFGEALQSKPQPQPYCWKCHNYQTVADPQGNAVTCPECKGIGDVRQ